MLSAAPELISLSMNVPVALPSLRHNSVYIIAAVRMHIEIHHVFDVFSTTVIRSCYSVVKLIGLHLFAQNDHILII